MSVSKMTNKVCLNSKCPAYAHLVYTVAMRCVLCRCDLQAAQRNTDESAKQTQNPTARSRSAARGA